VAPIRISDFGGWTDTWFAGQGRVLNIAVYPYVEVQLRVLPRGEAGKRVTIFAENYGERYSIAVPKGHYEKHPLLEAAIEYMGVPEDMAIEVRIYSEAPVGCSTGTSAAVSVALIGALDRLTNGHKSAYEIARTAHTIEAEMLKQQSGIQDQLASAYGGINFIEMYQYPHAAVSPVQVPNTVWWDLESRLSLIYIGHAHSSSRVHEMVIRELEAAGPAAAKLTVLRQTPLDAKAALGRGDMAALGQTMQVNTEAQRHLHPDLISPAHQQIIDIAQAHGALGWKVNGAGGDGGSVTLLSGPEMAAKRAMLRVIEQANPAFKVIPIYLSRFGLRVWETMG
jgi:D-glycero-alpha-D-manno-heptose-7-phosphate kinase